MRFQLVRPGDVFVILFSLVLLAAAWGSLYRGSDDPVLVRIMSPEGEWLYSLDTETDLLIPGDLGTTAVHIHGGEAWVSDSPCRDKVCVSMGKVSSLHGWIACLPNRVFIQVVPAHSTGEAEVDGVSF
ncbi:MAG: NusG domain II-containing protein [Spirochaetales bacterium]|nr:NusG domain II-containing protein [Spirochaetales bacterium]